MTALRAIPRWAMDTLRMALVLAVGLTIFSVYSARGDNHDLTFYACLYAGSLSQVNTTAPPANCGRGTHVQWTSESGVTGLTTVIPRVGQSVDLDPGESDFSVAECLEGEVATGGGYSTTGSIRIINNAPTIVLSPADAWEVRGLNTSETVPGNFISWVLCASTGAEAP